mgnify:CR=1 FL=1
MQRAEVALKCENTACTALCLSGYKPESPSDNTHLHARKFLGPATARGPSFGFGFPFKRSRPLHFLISTLSDRC